MRRRRRRRRRRRKKKVLTHNYVYADFACHPMYAFSSLKCGRHMYVHLYIACTYVYRKLEL